MSQIAQTIRSKDWWEYKIPPLLAIAYATVMQSPRALYSTAGWLLFLFGSVFIGAIYVSLINDITDIADDEASGKSNRMAAFPAEIRWIFPALCIMMGLGFEYFYWPDKLSAMLYVLPWISFTLYSCKPFRLKERKLLGVLADACGAHFFISLLMVSSMSFFLRQPVNIIWFMAVGIWSFAYGLRGILFHQFLDKENDAKAGITTFAQQTSRQSFKLRGAIILGVELLAFATMLIFIGQTLAYIFLVIYLLSLLLRKRLFGYEIISIIVSPGRPFQIFMADYYQFFFPLALLILASLADWRNIPLLIIHSVLFPHKMLAYYREAKRWIFK